MPKVQAGTLAPEKALQLLRDNEARKMAEEWEAKDKATRSIRDADEARKVGELMKKDRSDHAILMKSNTSKCPDVKMAPAHSSSTAESSLAIAADRFHRSRGTESVQPRGIIVPVHKVERPDENCERPDENSEHASEYAAFLAAGFTASYVHFVAMRNDHYGTCSVMRAAIVFFFLSPCGLIILQRCRRKPRLELSLR